VPDGGAGLRILDVGGSVIDTNGATGRLVRTLFAGIAQWERESMLEGHREGIAKARADGKYRGQGAERAGQGGRGRGYVQSWKEQGGDCRRAWDRASQRPTGDQGGIALGLIGKLYTPFEAGGVRQPRCLVFILNDTLLVRISAIYPLVIVAGIDRMGIRIVAIPPVTTTVPAGLDISCAPFVGISAVAPLVVVA
jgi:hypothetical protein